MYGNQDGEFVCGYIVGYPHGLTRSHVSKPG